MFFEKQSIQIRGQSDLAVAISNGQLITSGGYISAETAIRNSDVWAAVNVISSDLARIKLASDSKKLTKLLNAPSPLTNRFSFMQSIIAQMLLTGNAYVIRRVKDNNEFWEYTSPN